MRFDSLIWRAFRLAALKTVAIIAVAGVATAHLIIAPPTPQPRIWVVDGDTVEADGVRYRLTWMDAPEIYHARCPAERERGFAAAVRLMALLQERGGEIEDTGRREKWGRKMGRLWIGRGEAREAWDEIAIREGLAARWSGRGPKPGWCPA